MYKFIVYYYYHILKGGAVNLLSLFYQINLDLSDGSKKRKCNLMKIKNFFKKKIPLWWLLLLLLVSIIMSIQILAEFKLHYSQQTYFTERLRVISEGIYKNLDSINPNKANTQLVEQSLIGAYHYSNDLKALINDVPEWTFLGIRKNIFSDTITSPQLTFSYVQSLIEQILGDYQKSYVLSSSNYNTIQLFNDAFCNVYKMLSENKDVSHKQFIECIDTLYTVVYLKNTK